MIFSFGTAGLHRIAWRPSRHRLLRTAYEAGFRAFDTAPLYGNGLAELEIGAALGAVRDKIAITTKFGIPVKLYGARYPHLFTALRMAEMALDRNYRASFDLRDWRAETMRGQVEASLKRLRTDHLDRLCLHEPLDLIPQSQWDDLMDMGQRLKTQGKIGKLGLSGSHACMAELVMRPGIEFVQTALGAVTRLAAQSGLPATAFGVFAAFMTAGEGLTFQNFLRDSVNELGLEQLILTSRRLDRVQAMKSLF